MCEQAESSITIPSSNTGEGDAREKRFRCEQQLAAAIYQLGCALSEQADATQITMAQSRQLAALEDLLQTPLWALLQQHFTLSTQETALLAVVYLFQSEPDLLAIYAGLSWYEQGPGISAERALSLIPSFAGRMQPAEKAALILPDSPLIQHGLMICRDPENPLHQPLAVAACLHGLMSGELYDFHNYTASLSRIEHQNNPATQAIYAEHYHAPARGINLLCEENLLCGEDIREKCEFITSLLESEHSEPTPAALWVIHDSGEPPQLIRQALLAARINTLTSSQALYWPSLRQDCSASAGLRQLAGWLISSPDILLFCDQPDTSQQNDDTEELWFKQTISQNAAHCFSLTSTTVQRAKGWQALYQDAVIKTRLTGTGTFLMGTDTTGTGTSVTDSSATEKQSGLQGQALLSGASLTGTDASFMGTGTASSSALSNADALMLAERYPLNSSQMAAVFSSLPAGEDSLTTHAIQEACLQRMHTQTQGLATFSLPRFTFSDMVLTDDTRIQLEELLARMRFQRELKNQTHGVMSGTQALFWGQPGTGKSMAAEAIAGTLCLPLYKVNLANVASKWIGETEKHLAKLFDQAEKQKAVLLFDEADAIFARRSEVESSHDKNANLGVSYLLQRMETYQGVLLLSTNFKANIDDAFLRRFTAVIEFPLPDKAHRKQLWQHVWQGSLKPADNINMDELITGFDLSPSQIRNIAERACLYALMDGSSVITQPHLAKSLRRELDKQSAGFIAAHHLTEWS